MVRTIIDRGNYRNIKVEGKSVELVLIEKNMPKLSLVVPELQKLVDGLIVKDVNVKLIDFPFCVLLGYKRYIKKENELEKPESCKGCKYYKDCPGVSNDYLELYGASEFIPINENRLMTDNEKCMITILKHKNNIPTKEMLELAPKFNICADCSTGNHAISAGEKLIRKGYVKKVLTKEGYVWSLIRLI